MKFIIIIIDSFFPFLSTFLIEISEMLRRNPTEIRLTNDDLVELKNEVAAVIALSNESNLTGTENSPQEDSYLVSRALEIKSRVMGHHPPPHSS